MKEHKLKFADWAPPELSNNIEDILRSHLSKHGVLFESLLPEGFDVVRILELMLNHPKMESVWKRLLKHAKKHGIEDCPEQLFQSVYRAVCYCNSYTNIVSQSERNLQLTKMQNAIVDLAVVLEQPGFECFNREYWNYDEGREPEEHDRVSLKTSLAGLHAQAAWYKRIKGYLPNTEKDPTQRLKVVFIRCLHHHFYREFKRPLDDIVVDLCHIILGQEVDKEFVRSRRRKLDYPSNEESLFGIFWTAGSNSPLDERGTD